jgi:Tripartite tricarboxylate transporter family receptor
MKQHSADPFTTVRRRLLRAGVGGLAALAGLTLQRSADAARGTAQRILCSGPAGSIPDLIARAVADQQLLGLGQAVVVDNRPGAAGQISVSALKAAAADGSTLLLAQGAIVTVIRISTPSWPTILRSTCSPCPWPARWRSGSPSARRCPRRSRRLPLSSPGCANTLAPPMSALRAPAPCRICWRPCCFATQASHGSTCRIRVARPRSPTCWAGRLPRSYCPKACSNSSTRHDACGCWPRRGRYAAPTCLRFLHSPSRADLSWWVKGWFAFFASGQVARATVEATSSALQDTIARPELSAAYARSGMTPISSSPATLLARIAAEQRFWQPVLRAYGIHAD